MHNIYKQGNPERSGFDSVNFHTSNISKYLDYQLQPIVQKILSYIQDTSDFLWKIITTETTADNSYLVFLDVRSLYMSIQNSEGIKVVKTSLGNFPRRAVATKDVTFIALIFTLNNFVINCKNYLQIALRAMGTICTPAYANTSIYHFQRKHIYPFFKCFTKLVKIHWWYIVYLDR